MEIENLIKTHPELIEAPIGLLEVLMINPKEPGNLEETLRTILRANLNVLSADACAILLINPITGQFLEKYLCTEETIDTQPMKSDRPQLDRLTQDVLGAVAVERIDASHDRILFLEHLNQHPEYANPFEGVAEVESIAAVSLLTHRKRQPMPLAVLFSGFAGSGKFDRAKRALMRILADQASSALQHTWSLRRYKEVARIGYEINSELSSVEGVFEKLKTHVPGILDSRHFFMMATHDAQRNTLDFHVVENGEYKVIEGQPFTAACAWVISNQHALSIRDYSVEKNYLSGQIVGVLEGTEPRIPDSIEFMPLKFRDTTLGVLSVQQNFANAYDEEDRHILELLANHVALALTNLRLFDNLNRLNDAGQKLTSQLNSEQILTLVTESIREVVKADVVTLYPYLPEKGLFQFPIHMSGDLINPDFPKPNYSRPDDLATLTLNIPAPVFAKDSRTLYAEVGGDPTIRQGNFEERERICSTAALPLRVGGEPVGVLFANFRSEQHFRPAQQKLIEGMANYAAIAIKNAREFGSLAHKRLKDMEVLQTIDRAISRTLDLNEILQTIVEEATNHLSHEGEKTLNGAILILNPITNIFEVKAASGPTRKLRVNKTISLNEEKGITFWVAQNAAPARVGDVHGDEWKDHYYQVDRKTVSELDVPLLDEHDAVVGVISLESDRKNRFSQEDQNFLMTLGNQAVLAIQNAQAYERQKQAKEAQEAVQKVQHQIVSELDFNKVAEFILEQALRLTKSRAGEVLLHDEHRGEIFPAAERGTLLPWKRGRRMPANSGISGWVIQHKQLLNVNVTQPPWDRFYVRVIRGVKWELAVPMLKGKKVLGVINIESTDPFSEYDEQLVTELASLAVIALSNAEMYEQEKNAVECFQLLYEAGQKLGEVLDPAEIDSAYKSAVKTFAKYKGGQVAIRRYDEEKQELILVHHSRPDSTNPLFLRMQIDEGVNGWVARNRKTKVVDDTLTPPKGIEPKSSDPQTRCLVATPIEFGKTYYGNVALSHPQPGYFRPTDIMLIEGLAHQLGQTIKRLEIFGAQQDAERRSKESEVMSSIGQSATELTHRLANDLGLVETYVETIKEAIQKHGVQDELIDETFATLLIDVNKVLGFNQALKDDVIALEKEVREPQTPSTVTMETLLDEAQRSFPNLPAKIDLVRNLEPNLPEVRVVPNQIISSLTNLVMNAMQAMPHGGTITLTAKRMGSKLEIAVQDTGIGIANNLQSRIFSLFYSTKGSSGFGLWSANRNAIANGGELKLESSAGKGAKFALVLPPAENLVL